MANEKEIALNDLMVLAEAAWEDLVDGSVINAKIILVPSEEWAETAPASLPYPTDVNLQERVIFECKRNTDEDSVKYALQGVDLGRWPLFFRVAISCPPSLYLVPNK